MGSEMCIRDRKQVGPKTEKVSSDNVAGSDDADLSDSLEGKKRCAWVTPNTGIFVPYLFDLFLVVILILLVLRCQCEFGNN